MADKNKKDIMQYESDIWAVADLLIAAGIPQSKFPDYMMPFFALIMLEGRMRNAMKRVEEESLVSLESDKEEFIRAFKDENCGYNQYIVEERLTLAELCKNDTSFEQDFKAYLGAFDSELKRLLGIGRGTESQKFLNLDGMAAELREKGILLSVVKEWAKVDLSAYDNSAITTLEEHIKRRWADMSAATAGEQYTPEDIISLIAEIVGSKIDLPKNAYFSLYDPTCGGANLLFGVADRLREEHGYQWIKTCGSELNDALYALSAIESLFRDDAEIQFGNTLTTIPFRDKSFEVVVANPPYGVKWSGYKKDIEKDKTGQFPFLPPVSDGQMLFMEHILWQLDKDKGLAVEVHNGSTLFSGDAGGGESEIRKYILDNDWLEAVIQMPRDEFFNTGIYTYLWVINKHKSKERVNQVMLIDASHLWKLLKKSKGNKRREMLPEHRAAIVQALRAFKSCEIGKVFNKEHFYYNKQQLTLLEVDSQGHSVLHTVCRNSKGEAAPHKIPLHTVGTRDETLTKFKSLKLEEAQRVMSILTGADSRQDRLVITDNHGQTFCYDTERETIVLSDAATGMTKNLGNGRFNFKMTKSAKTHQASISCTIEPVYTRDYEIIPYHRDPQENAAGIDAFLRRYVTKPYHKRENTVGVEINFNKEFYVPEQIEPVEDILAELAELDSQIKELKI